MPLATSGILMSWQLVVMLGRCAAVEQELG